MRQTVLTQSDADSCSLHAVLLLTERQTELQLKFNAGENFLFLCGFLLQRRGVTSRRGSHVGHKLLPKPQTLHFS